MRWPSIFSASLTPTDKESSQRFRDRTKEKNKQRDARLQELEMRLPMLEQQLRQAQLGQPPCVMSQPCS